MQKLNKGFTLVELIVVITILAILGSIAFIAMQGYTKSARDSQRIADVGQFRSGIEIFQVEAGVYPMPDNVDNSILVQSNPVNYPGTTGELVASIARLSDAISDPATLEEYGYAIEGNKKSYQLTYSLEDDGSASILNEAHAADFVDTEVVGNFNGVFAKTQTGDILTMPSLFAKHSSTGDVDFSTPTALEFTLPGQTTTVSYTPTAITAYTDTEDLITKIQAGYDSLSVDASIVNLEKVSEVNDLVASDDSSKKSFETEFLGEEMPSCGFGFIELSGVCVNPNGFTKIATGTGHSCGIMLDQTVKCWGANGNGQLGDGTTTNRYTPVIVSGLTNVSDVSLGTYHSCVLLSDQTVKCWGNNNYGQLGNGTNFQRTTPVSVSGLSNVSDISLGTSHSCALLSDQTVKCWGLNNSGQIGDGTTTNRYTPVLISSLAGVVDIALGYNRSCALLSDQTIKCWGHNGNGQLGDGTTTQRTTPVLVSGLSNVSDISLGYFHSCALLSDQTVKCWGNNNNGQLGNGTTTQRTTPVSVSSLTSVSDISIGHYHSCALLSDQTVKCWGNNGSGRIGDGTTTNRYTPVLVSGLTNVSSISIGGYHSCALKPSQTVKCWGNNGDGRIGDGTTTDRYTPVDVEL